MEKPTADPVLIHARSIVKNYGGVQALRGVDIEIFAGEVHAIMGENGAGKSTFGKILAGAVSATSGTIEVDGIQATIANPVDAQRLGIAIIFQELDLFPNLTVAENIAIQNTGLQERTWVSRNKMAEFCLPYLDRVGLKCDPTTPLGNLHIGHQQLVAIARALSMNARCIVFDESTSALTDELVENLFEVIRSLRDQGVACVYVSHKMDEIFRICDRITVLRDGQYVDTKNAKETNHKELVRLMIGHELNDQERSKSHATDNSVLVVEGLETPQVENVSFTLHRGEVIGLAGLVGSGRGEVGRALFGLTPITTGKISKLGKPFRPRNPRDAVQNKVGLLPRDRKREGLMMQMSVRENASLAILDRLSVGGLVRASREVAASQSIAKATRLRAASDRMPVSALSGGNQQKTLLGRWLLLDPDVLFLDDPTRGVDVGAKKDIYELIEDEAAKGKGLLLVSSELPELLRCCDRIIVMNGGRQVAIVDAASATSTSILQLATASLDRENQ